MRGRQADPPARAGQPVKLLHRPQDIGDVLDDVDRLHGVEGVVPERVGEVVEIASTSARLRGFRSIPIEPGSLFIPQPTSSVRT